MRRNRTRQTQSAEVIEPGPTTHRDNEASSPGGKATNTLQHNAAPPRIAHTITRLCAAHSTQHMDGTSASCVGSNPTGVNPQAQRKAQHKLTAIDCAELSLPVLPTGAQFFACGTVSTGDDRYLWIAACCLPCCCCRAHICRLVCACACQRGPRRHVARQVATWQPSG